MAYIGQSLTEGTRRAYTFVATSGQTTFNAVFGVGAVDVFQNGILLQPSDYNSSSGSSVVLGVGAAVNDEITIIAHNTFSVADTLTASQGGTFTGNVQFDGSFTSKGIDDNADATAITIDALENVMIGTTTQDAPVDNGGSGVTLRPQGVMLIGGTGTSIYANREDSDGEVMQFRKDGGHFGGLGVSGGNNLYISGTASNHAGVTFATQSVLPTTQGTVNNNTVDIGQNGNAFKDLYLGGGAYLGGTGAANKLEDYETGTWSPVLDATSGNGPNVNYAGASPSGWYTKIGRLVHVAFYIPDFTVSGTVSGNIGITGLPFAKAAVPSSGGVISAYYVNWARPNFVALKVFSGTTLGFLSQQNGSTWAWETLGALAGGSSRYLEGAITYTAT